MAGEPIVPSRYDLICVTSPNAVPFLVERSGGAAAFAGIAIAAIGPGTAAALRSVGLEPSVVAARSVGEGLLAALGGMVAGRRVLIARAADAREIVPRGLAEAGAASVEIAVLYRTIPLSVSPAALRGADLVTFASSSAVRSVVSSLPATDLPAIRGVSIGPVTSATMRELGIEVVGEAARHDLDGLVAAVVEVAGNR